MKNFQSKKPPSKDIAVGGGGGGGGGGLLHWLKRGSVRSTVSESHTPSLQWPYKQLVQLAQSPLLFEGAVKDQTDNHCV